MIGQRDLDLIPNPHAFDPPRAKLPLPGWGDGFVCGTLLGVVFFAFPMIFGGS